MKLPVFRYGKASVFVKAFIISTASLLGLFSSWPIKKKFVEYLLRILIKVNFYHGFS